MLFAGTPATVSLSETSCITTELGAIIELSPTVIPPNILAPLLTVPDPRELTFHIEW